MTDNPRLIRFPVRFRGDSVGIVEIDRRDLQLAVTDWLTTAFDAEGMTQGRIGKWATEISRYLAAISERIERDADRWMEMTVLSAILGNQKRAEWLDGLRRSDHPLMILAAEASRRHISEIIGEQNGAELDRLATALKRAAKVQRGRKRKRVEDRETQRAQSLHADVEKALAAFRRTYRGDSSRRYAYEAPERLRTEIILKFLPALKPKEQIQMRDEMLACWHRPSDMADPIVARKLGLSRTQVHKLRRK